MTGSAVPEVAVKHGASRRSEQEEVVVEDGGYDLRATEAAYNT